MKKVVNNETVAHLWANEQQTEAYTPNRAFYFYGKNIYSYGSHFLIAKHITNNKGEKGILFTTCGYSNTTAKHISYTYRAIPDKSIIMYVINPQSTPAENFIAWNKQIDPIYTKLAKAKKPELYLSELSRLNDQIKKYATFMGVEIPEAIKVRLEITNKAEIIEAVNKANEIKAANEAKEAKAKQKENKKQIDKFRNFERFSPLINFSCLRYNETTQRIETSQRIEIPVEAAKRLYHTIKEALKDINNPTQEILENLNILSYKVKNIQKDFIEVGCHKIEIKEINRIAKQLSF